MPLAGRLAVLFFFSGVSALVYQVLWMRLMGLVFGVTVYAATTVLASFMAGLALGSFVAGRLAPRVRAPLAWFGAVEILIGIFALGTWAALDDVTRMYAAIHAMLSPGAVATTALRFMGASLLLIAPTTLMGASLPLVMRSALATDVLVAPRFALLYAANTAGAIAGTLLVGFIMVERIGIAASFQVAASLNVLIGVAAIAIGGRTSARPTAVTPLVPHVPVALNLFERRVLIAFALSGFAALALEVIWFRLIVLFVPATTYAFSTMLAAVLFGIAAGSALAGPLLRRPGNDRRRLAVVELSIGIAAVLSVVALAVTYRAGWRTSGAIQASLLAIAPATILMGIAFPIGVRLLTTAHAAVADAPRRIGVLYAVNVGAGILGAIVAGFALLPRTGTVAGVLTMAGVHAIAGLIVLDARPGGRRGLGVATVAALVLLAAGVPDPFQAVLARRYGDARLIWREEGAQSTVTVMEDEGVRTLYLDGLHQANDSPIMVRVHRQLGHLPMALHPDPREALVIGLGAGATAAAVSAHPGVQVDLVELAAPVVRASVLFSHINDGVAGQPHVRLRVDDARNHLLVTRQRYDVITADIIQPIHAGAGNVYSREYFTLVRDALREDGIVLQWIGHRDAAEYDLILRTFLDVFPQTTAWADGTLLVAGKRPLRIDLRAMERKLGDAASRAALTQVDITSVDALLALYTAGPEELRAFVGDGPVLTDDRPRLEFFRSLRTRGVQVDVSGLRGDIRRHLVAVD